VSINAQRNAVPNAASVEDRWGQMLSNAEAIQREITENTPTLFDVTISTSHIVSMYWRAIRLNDGIIILPKAEFGRGGSNSCPIIN
jgi:hypothetical protein